MKSGNKRPGSFSRIMSRGQQKVRTTKETKALLRTLSQDDYKAIAKLIQRWIADTPPKK